MWYTPPTATNDVLSVPKTANGMVTSRCVAKGGNGEITDLGLAVGRYSRMGFGLVMGRVWAWERGQEWGTSSAATDRRWALAGKAGAGAGQMEREDGDREMGQASGVGTKGTCG